MKDTRSQPKPGAACTSCGCTFHTPPREDELHDHCPACALEYELDTARVRDLRRVIEAWGMEASLTPRQTWEYLSLLNGSIPEVRA
jgi:hypothetical protein